MGFLNTSTDENGKQLKTSAKDNGLGGPVTDINTIGLQSAKKYERLNVSDLVLKVDRARDAIDIEVYVEQGMVRVTTNTTVPTKDLGQPITQGYERKYAVSSINIISVTEQSVVTIIHR